MRRLLLVLCLFLGLVVWVGGIAGDFGRGGAANFTFVSIAEIGTLDPNRMSWAQDLRLGYSLWEGLYTLDPATLKAVPGVADQIDVSPDACVYRFHLRDSARWSDGSKVVAGDFVFAWKRMLDTPGDYTYLLGVIAGADDYAQAVAAGKKADFGKVGVRLLSDSELEVRLAHPVSYFPDLCAFSPMWPLHEKSMRPFAQPADSAGRVRYAAGFTRPPNLVTNGPYRLESWDFRRRLRLAANAHYWDAASVKSPVVDVLIAEDPLAAFLIYDTGGADWLPDVPGQLCAQAKSAARKDLQVFPGFGSYFYSLNCQATLPDGTKNPLVDVRVRKALALALDPGPIVQNVTRMGEAPGRQYIPPGIFTDYTSPTALAVDADQARRLLAEAGYPGGKGFPSLTILVNNEGQHSEIAQVVSRQWKTSLGLSIPVDGVELKSFRDKLRNKKYGIARASWIGDYNDPSTFTDKYLSTSENNDAAWVSVAYDDLCRRASVEPDKTRRLGLLAKAEGILLDEAPIIPVYHYVNRHFLRPTVSGIPFHPTGMVMLKSAYRTGP